jgi:hypothetical protein
MGIPDPLVAALVNTSACHWENAPGFTEVGAYPHATDVTPELGDEVEVCVVDVVLLEVDELEVEILVDVEVVEVLVEVVVDDDETVIMSAVIAQMSLPLLMLVSKQF